MSTVNFDIVRNAITSQSEISLMVPSEEGARECPSKFVTQLDEGIVVTHVAEREQLLASAIENKLTINVSFKQDYRTISFASRIIRVDAEFALGDQTLAVMLLETPGHVEATQRRQTYRAKVPAEYGLKARVWTIQRFAYLSDQPTASHEILAEIADLSANGIGVHLTMRDGSLPKVTPDDRLRVQLKRKDWDFVLEGRIRPAHKSEGGSLWTGIVFKKLENDIKGRKTLSLLTHMVGELQRQEVRLLRKHQDETEIISAELAHCGAHGDDIEFHI